ncbi:Gp138 family membrane-puncturing spike protein [Pantoea stewartii]|uniref:Gp138 family membrane-puncturing spike protein n=1 Tax=Pantoea stewartii TaxID=66269 RepID=UPI001625E391|nr:Gp138 family membrane-puncturing spike protein [Pantoea stewartii]MBC0852574.1 translation initiation factor IF-2 [Pantoea stewartii]
MASVRPLDNTEVTDAVSSGARHLTKVAHPGIIRSFDSETVTCTVEIGVMGVVANPVEDPSSIDRIEYSNTEMPILIDAPLVFPRGGGCTLTFPVQAGDECLVVFSDRCIDFWWQNGGVQPRVLERNHSFSDAFVIPGPQSQAKKISNISPTAAQLRTDDGSAFVEVSAGGDVTATSGGQITLNAPQVTINGNVQVNGTLTATGDVIGSGKSLSTHTHGNVQNGSSHTGAPD